jgi:hypothetical protein
MSVRTARVRIKIWKNLKMCTEEILFFSVSLDNAGMRTIFCNNQRPAMRRDGIFEVKRVAKWTDAPLSDIFQFGRACALVPLGRLCATTIVHVGARTIAKFAHGTITVI